MTLFLTWNTVTIGTTRSTLPVHLGGTGVRRVIILPAFLSSAYGISKLANSMLNKSCSDEPKLSHFEEAMSLWNEMNAVQLTDKTIQKSWDIINLKRIMDNFSYRLNTDNARHFALEKLESNAWLMALPSHSIGTLLDNNTFRISMGIRLGCEICTPHVCICGEKVDAYGHHGLSCVSSAGRFSRHQEINNIISRALQSAKIPNCLESCGLSRDDGKRPDGMTLIPWSKGQCLVWDATCSDTLAPSHLPNTSLSAGSAAKLTAGNKKRKYSNILDQNYSFLPFAVETMGPWSGEAIVFIDKLGKIIHSQSGEPRSRSFLIQRISMAIQRGNAISVMGTFSFSQPLSEIFYVLR